MRQITGDPLVDVTIYLVLATLGIVVATIIFGIIQVRSQERITKLQGRLTAAQEKLAEQQEKAATAQKIAADATVRSAELQEKAMVMEAMIKINEILNDDTSIMYRRIVFDYFVGIGHGTFDKVADSVSGEFDQAAAMADVSDELKTMYLDAHVRKTAKSWYALEKWVIKERGRRHDDHYRSRFEALGKAAVEQWKIDFPDEPLEIKKIDKHTES